ncbi:MAG TPA: TIGR00730 family Rossman fold protein [Tepidisphaeraceae bacterium]|nr:TIGR00730 family Rossman fold protein [Tepidisphaeraceae bacterium]
MNTGIRAVTVYCSSSKKVAPIYSTTAAELGKGIAQRGWKLIYGGNHVGCMACLADGARAGGGQIIGITPQLLVNKGIADHQCDELLITTGMRERKAIMEQRGDAFIALPGGIGTLEEVFEILVGRHLGFHNKPIVLLNVANFYDPLLHMLQHGLEQGFIREGTTELMFVTAKVEAALNYLQHHADSAPSVPAQTLPPRIE